MFAFFLSHLCGCKGTEWFIDMNQKRIALFFLVYPDLRRNFEDIEFEYVSAICKRAGHEVHPYMIEREKVDLNLLIDFKPDYVGFALCFNNQNSSFEMAESIKKALKETHIFVFGHYFSLYFDKIMKDCKYIEFGFTGESEGAVIKYFDTEKTMCSLKNIPGIVYREEDEIVRNENSIYIQDLDELPFMDRESMPIENRSALLSTSRGCISQCTFCRRKQLYRGWRGRTPKNIVDEIEQIIHQKGIKVFMFNDNSFEDPDMNLERLEELCKEIIGRHLDITYNAYFRGDFYKKANPRTAELLSKSGLLAVQVGIESGNDEDLKLYRKLQKLDDNINTVNYFQSAGFYIAQSFINFNPYSTCQRLRANLNYLQRYHECFRFFTFLDLLSYTPLFEKVKKDNLVIPKGRFEGRYSYNYWQLDNSVYNYIFKDHGVQSLADYIKNFLTFSNIHYQNLWSDFLFYAERHYYQIRLLQKNIKDQSVKNAFENHLRRIHSIYQKIDGVLYQWIQDLLTITETGGSIYKYENSTKKLDVISSIGLAVKDLSIERSNIFYRLSRAGFYYKMASLLD